MKKLICAIYALVLACGVSFAQDEYLTVAVSEFNKKSPKAIADGLVLTKTTYDGSVLTLNVNAEAGSQFDVDSIAKDRQAAKMAIGRSFAKDFSMKSMMEYMYNKDFPLAINITNPSTSKSIRVLALTDDLKTMTGNYNVVRQRTTTTTNPDGTVTKTVEVVNPDGTTTTTTTTTTPAE
jgi:hypothetical protein